MISLSFSNIIVEHLNTKQDRELSTFTDYRNGVYNK